MLNNSNKKTKLLPSVFKKRFDKNYDYVMDLKIENLLRNYLFEAGLWSYSGNSSTTIDPDEQVESPVEWHWGWESVTCEIRGHFLGHWLSAASKIYRITEDPVILGKINKIINSLKECQISNGHGWVASIPEKYMKKMENKQEVWAPHYTIHKTMMGLLDVHRNTNNSEALNILINFSEWFINWCKKVDEETFQNILSYETGGMLEIWAELLEITGNSEYQKLIDLYYRNSFFEQLLDGKDVLTNKHANTQIAEVLGIAKAYEVTNNKKYRDIVEAFWREAVDERGTYATGGISCGELWTPKQDFSGRLGKAQEHCTVYHMIRLAQFLFKWTKDTKYADFEELNIYNGILAQQNKNTGMVTYFLDMEPCSNKNWGDPLKHFWCCHGTLVQAQASYSEGIYYNDNEEVFITQFIPSETEIVMNGVKNHISLIQDLQNGSGPLEQSNKIGKRKIQSYDLASKIPLKRPDSYNFRINIRSNKKSNYTIKIRIPEWSTKTVCFVDGVLTKQDNVDFFVLNHTWKENEIVIIFEKKITTVPLLGNSNRVAFRDGPLVLAGLTEKDQTLLFSDVNQLFDPLNERHHSFWRDSTYITSNQQENIKFIPIAEVTNQTYNIYFEKN